MNRKEFFKKLGFLTAGALLPWKELQAQVSGKDAVSAKLTPGKWQSDKIYVGWIGHSTMLISLYGKIILTDPVFSRCIGFDLFGITIGPARYTEPALSIEEIPRPDIILLSHAHMDHMDYPSLKFLAKKYKNEIDCITAFNTMDVVDDLPWKSLREMDWGESLLINDLSLKALKTRHFGWRYPWERDRSRGYFSNGRSFNAYLLERKGKKVLFGGDTAFTDDFQKSGESTDVALMPIGAYYPWRANHCSPEEAIQMAKALKAKVFIPMHCNTFKQGMEPVEEPMQRLKAALPNSALLLGLDEIGKTFEME
jgi:L-ascorbate metabolism protein UlaG (beta-lactamase superfamily)